MAEGKRSFIIYSDWKELFETLEDSQCATLIRHIFKYVNDENPELSDQTLKPVWALIQPTLKRDLKKWQQQIEQRSEAGKRSAENRKRNSTTVDENQRASTDNVNVSVNVNDNVNVNKDSKLFEMFRRAASLRITDDMLLSEIGKFLNKYPQPEKHTPGLINSWCSRIELPKPKFVI